jgi:hypothetical protein
MPQLNEFWKAEQTDETDKEQLQNARTTREAVATSMTKALEQARILAYELLDSWSDLLVGDAGPTLRVAHWHVAQQLGNEHGLDAMDEEVLRIRTEKADAYKKKAIGLLSLVRRAPASRFPCFPVLLNNEEEILRLDMEAKICPLFEDRMQRCEEEEWQGMLPGVPGESHGAELENSPEFQQIEEHAKFFVYLLLQLNYHRTEWERGTQDCAKKRAVAERVLHVLKQALHFEAHTLEATQMEIVLALLALAVIKAITLLDTLTDRSDKDKLEDTEATIHVSESVCNALRESPYPGPARTCPQSWRVNYRKKCLSLFMQTAGLHDEMSVRSVNQNAHMEAQKNNEAAKTFIELASGFQGRMAEESTCKACGNRTCADYKEEEEHSKKLASLLDPMRTRIYRHEEVIRLNPKP